MTRLSILRSWRLIIAQLDYTREAYVHLHVRAKREGYQFYARA